MLTVAVAALVVAALAIAAAAQTVRSLIRQQARERQQLLDRMMHLAGRTWTPPPGDQWTIPVDEDVALVAAPEQFPDDHDWGE